MGRNPPSPNHLESPKSSREYQRKNTEAMSKAVVDSQFWASYQMTEEEFRMRISTSPHHTNPRSATLDFWRKTTPYDQYKIIQHKRRTQMNVPTSSGKNKEEHLLILISSILNYKLVWVFLNKLVSFSC